MNVVAPKDVGRTKTDNTEQLVVRVPKALRDRLEALIPALAPPGVSVTMTDVVRTALMKGVESLEAQHATAATSKPSRRK